MTSSTTRSSAPGRRVPSGGSGVSGRAGTGLVVAAVSAVSFGLSGPLAKSLIDAGWSSAAASLARLGIGAAVLLVPMLVVGRRRLMTIARAPRVVVAYGVVGVAVVQLSFFNAVRYLDVAVALLVEYSAPVLVIVYLWVVRGRRPTVRTVLGACVAVIGLLVVIGGSGAGLAVDPVGVVWAVAAAVGLAGYFLLAERNETEDVVAERSEVTEVGGERSEVGDTDVDPLALTCGGLTIGALLVALAGAVGVLPMTATTGSVTLGGGVLPWWVAAVGVAVVSTSLAYVTGVTAVRLLGSTTASFVALAEVVTSAAASWVLLGQSMAPVQMAGAVVLLVGIVTVRSGSVTRSDVPPPAPTSPTGIVLPPSRT